MIVVPSLIDKTSRQGISNSTGYAHFQHTRFNRSHFFFFLPHFGSLCHQCRNRFLRKKGACGMVAMFRSKLNVPLISSLSFFFYAVGLCCNYNTRWYSGSWRSHESQCGWSSSWLFSLNCIVLYLLVLPWPVRIGFSPHIFSKFLSAQLKDF